MVWDTNRMGRISIQEIAKELISCGLALNKDQVMKMIEAVQPSNCKSEFISIQAFIKIFERESFTDRANSALLNHCKMVKLEEAELLKQASYNIKLLPQKASDTENLSLQSPKSKVSGLNSPIKY